MALNLIPSALGNSTLVNNLLGTAGVLLSLLPTVLQNGNSQLGLLSTPNLPAFLDGDGASSLSGVPWGNRTANGTNYYEDVPDTGVVRTYDFVVSRGIIAPDGVNKSVLLINGQFPGASVPLLPNWGDYFEVTVHNEIEGPEEGTALHWHGLTQKATPWFDGVASVQQCPIAPGSSFTYKFQADLYGTSWYHSHYSAQYAGGLLGPMVIYGPKNADYDIDLGPVVLQDYYHKDYFTLVQQAETPNDPAHSQQIVSDNTLIQGKMDFDCDLTSNETDCTGNAGLAKFKFTPGKTHRLRLVNTGAQAHMVFSIDGHTLTVIANDFVPIVPYETDVVTLGVGQRTDVLVTANALIGNSFWMRVRQPSICAESNQPFGLAAIYYDGADTTQKPVSIPNLDWLTPTLFHCANEPLINTVPYYSIAPDPPQTMETIAITQATNETGFLLWQMNNQTFRGDYNDPVLLLANKGNDSYPLDPEWNVYNFGSNDTMIVYFQNTVPFSHPMHIHGQNMYILNEGVGSWDGRTVIRPNNPMRRDTQILQPSGYLVALLKADNPGVWPFHCHIAWHVSTGLYVNIMQKPDQIEQLNIPDSVFQTCDTWNNYSSNNVVDQIDSGLKRR